MKDTTAHLHIICQDWTRTLQFYKGEIPFFKKRLEEIATKNKERASKRTYGRKIAYILVLKLISLFCASKLYFIILHSYLDSFCEYLYPWSKYIFWSVFFCSLNFLICCMDLLIYPIRCLLLKFSI